MLPRCIKKKFWFHLEVSQGFPSTTSNDSVKLVYPRLLWPKVKEPQHSLDMSGIMLWSLSGGSTVEKSGFLNSWLGLKHARFDISGGKRESRQKALEERRLFLDQHVKFSAWWFRQRLLSSSYSLHWSCCMAVKERLGPSETKKTYCRWAALGFQWSVPINTQLHMVHQGWATDLFPIRMVELLSWIHSAHRKCLGSSPSRSRVWNLCPLRLSPFPFRSLHLEDYHGKTEKFLCLLSVLLWRAFIKLCHCW